MRYKIEFQYKPPGDVRPDDCVQDDSIESEKGDAMLIPNVGDSVVYRSGGKPKAFKVVSRHFSYVRDFCAANTVVTDISREEMSARLKE